MGTAGLTIRLYLENLKPYWVSTAAFLVLATVGMLAADIATPFLIAKILEVLAGVAAGSARLDQVEQYFWLFLISSLIGMVAGRAIGFLVTRRQADELHRLEQTVFERLTLQSPAFFASTFAGRLVSQAGRFVRSYESLEDMFWWQAYPLVLRVSASLVVLLLTLPSVALAILVWATLFVASTVWMVVKKQPLDRQSAGTDTTITGQLSDVISNALTMLSFGRRQTEVASYRRTGQERRRIRRRAWTVSEWVWTYTHIMGVVVSVIALWLSIQAVGAGTASLAIVLVAQFYVLRLVGDLGELPDVLGRAGTAFGDAAEMTLILDRQPEVRDPAKPLAPAPARGLVEFDRIEFRYSGCRTIFRSLSLAIRPGERIGLVGHSGSGKSTLVKLLLRFADVQGGTVRVDGQNVRDLRQRDLRGKIAYVAQEPLLFHRSLAENIRYGRPEAADREVRKAARLAHADQFISALPDGYDTLVGERGVKLSGGERQRVAIARAMLSQAPILVLDEATSSLDSATEQLITDALRELMRGRTTIAIAHRLSTIQSLDRIVVLDRGRLAEQGTHQELLALKGIYYDLWTHQTGGFLGE